MTESGNLFTTPEHLRHALGTASLAIYRHPLATVHYGVKDGKAAILDVLAQIPVDVQTAACDYAFDELKARRLEFHALREPWNPGYPYYFTRRSENIVIHLPRDSDTYLSRLGPKTRQHLRRDLRKIRNDEPDFRFAHYVAGDITPETINDVLALNVQRMTWKGTAPHFPEAGLQDELHSYGLVVLGVVGEAVQSGTLITIVDKNAYLHTIAHSPRYNRYSLGLLTLLESTTELIRRGVVRFNLLWGESEYKYRMGGVKESLYFGVVLPRGLRFSILSFIGQMPFAGRILIAAMLNPIRPWYRRLRKLRASAAHPTLDASHS